MKEKKVYVNDAFSVLWFTLRHPKTALEWYREPMLRNALWKSFCGGYETNILVNRKKRNKANAKNITQ